MSGRQSGSVVQTTSTGVSIVTSLAQRMVAHGQVYAEPTIASSG